MKKEKKVKMTMTKRTTKSTMTEIIITQRWSKRRNRRIKKQQ